MNTKKIAKAEDISDYIAFMISEFSEENKLSMTQSFDYLYRYGGVGFLDKHYEVEHCENPAITLRDLHHLCQREGGRL